MDFAVIDRCSEYNWFNETEKSITWLKKLGKDYSVVFDEDSLSFTSRCKLMSFDELEFQFGYKNVVAEITCCFGYFLPHMFDDIYYVIIGDVVINIDSNQNLLFCDSHSGDIIFRSNIPFGEIYDF